MPEPWDGPNLDGVQSIAAERRHHADHGFDAEHDARYTGGELAYGALQFLECALGERDPTDPFELIDESLTCKPRGAADSAHDLVKAGGLIAAEIDRLKAFRPQPVDGPVDEH